MRPRDGHRRGTRASQPAASSVAIGVVYFVTDEGVQEYSNGVSWESYSSPGVPSSVALYASRPAPSAANPGKLFLPSDGYYVERDSGAAWASWGPLFPMTPPIDTGWSWFNQGAASVVTTNGGIALLLPAAAGDNKRGRVVTAPATPYSITMALLPAFLAPASTPTLYGAVFRQSSDGKLATFGLLHNGTKPKLVVAKYNSPTSFSANYAEVEFPCPPSLLWLRLTDNGTNRICSFSADGVNFIQFFSVGRTDFLTADQVGFFADPYTASYSGVLTLLSWKFT